MEVDRFDPYLGILAALIFFAAGFIALTSLMPIRQAPLSANPLATSTLSVVSGFAIPDLSLSNILPPSLSQTTSSSKSTAPKASTTAKTAVPSPLPAKKPVTAPVPAPPKQEEAPANTDPLTASAATLRSALVNILCDVRIGNTFQSVIGSGVLVSPRGIILTNAHIGQYFLFPAKSASCKIRTGMPATDRYLASLIYLSPSWVDANRSILSQTSPKGTGEFDFALLGITQSATSTPLPASFAFVQLDASAPDKGTPVAIASYGAQYLKSSQVQMALYPTVVLGSVKEVLTFEKNTADVIELTGSIAAQRGSSGGGVITTAGKLVGLITTSSVEGELTSRRINALTADYLRREYKRETGSTFDALLMQPIADSIAAFAPRIPVLEGILLNGLR